MMKGVIVVTAIVLCTNIVLANENDCSWIFCTEEYDPVCGEDSDGNRKTYGNRCEIALDQCLHPEKGIKQIYRRSCEFIIGKRPLSEEKLVKLAENSDIEGDLEEDIDELHESSQIDYELSEEEEVLDEAEDDMLHTVDFGR
ncbi:Kazal-type serine protease inhibitor domain [Popillia japonica]|uniref:Kazal-type serine protease inhibitor domain n=1 Tax=Popillia japonica TaxID=7064 RepID=A0AAW1J138_POPJA